MYNGLHKKNPENYEKHPSRWLDGIFQGQYLLRSPRFCPSIRKCLNGRNKESRPLAKNALKAHTSYEISRDR